MTLEHTWLRLKAKNLNQWVRLVITKVPPFNLLGFLYYRIIFKTRIYNFINREAIRLYKENLPNLTTQQRTIISKIQNDGIYSGQVESLSNQDNIFKGLENDAEKLINHRITELTKNDDFRFSKIRGIGRNTNYETIPKSIADFFIGDAVCPPFPHPAPCLQSWGLCKAGR